MYSSSELDTTDPPEEDDEGQIYQLIYDMGTTTNVQEEKEEVKIPSSSENTPVHVKIDPGKRPQAVVANKKGIDMDVLDSIQEIPRAKANAKEKPWRKAGADISDYFNYGFDEESWTTYCKKQAKIRSPNSKLYTNIMGQKGCTRHEGKEKCAAYTSSGSPSVLASRQLSAATDVMGGKPGCSSRVEGRQYLRYEGNNSQVATPEDFSSLLTYIPPPPFLYLSGPPSPFSSATLDRDSKRFDGPSSSRHAHLSGVPSFIPRYMASNAGVINTAKAWECSIWEERCEKYRERSREHGRDTDSHRGRYRDRENCFPSHSKEERVRDRDTAERGHKHTFDRFSGEKEERNREKRHKDNEEGWQKPSSSSSSRRSRRDAGEDRDGQSRRKNKKRRNRKGKETDQMFSADQERKF